MSKVSDADIKNTGFESTRIAIDQPKEEQKKNRTQVVLLKRQL